MFPPRSCLLAAVCAFGLSVTAFTEEKTPTPVPAANETAKQILTYPDAEAEKHIGEESTITGKVIAISTSKQGNIYLNFGARFPKQTFSGVVPSKDAEKVGDVKKFEGKSVTVTGKIERYNDKPQIVISSPDQIKAVEEAAAAAKP